MVVRSCIASPYLDDDPHAPQTQIVRVLPNCNLSALQGGCAT